MYGVSHSHPDHAKFVSRVISIMLGSSALIVALIQSPTKLRLCVPPITEPSSITVRREVVAIQERSTSWSHIVNVYTGMPFSVVQVNTGAILSVTSTIPVIAFHVAIRQLPKKLIIDTVPWTRSPSSYTLSGVPSPQQGQSCPAIILIWFWSHAIIGVIQVYTQSQQRSVKFARYATFVVAFQVNT